MSRQKSNQNLSKSSIGTVRTTAASSDATHSARHIAQNFLLVWLDVDIDQSTQNCQNTLVQLRSISNDVNIFTKADKCIDFLTEVDDKMACLILGSTLGQQIVPLIHDIPQLNGIYIFCENKSAHEQWAKHWVKVKGVHTEIMPICESIQLNVKQWNQDSISVSFIAMDEEISNKNLDQLEPSFMYTQIFKEILLEMEYDEQSIKNFILFWRHHYLDNISTLNVISEFERDYCPQSCMRWYTRECFIYQMLNRALRTLESDTIIKMGFFIRDLHHQIEELYQKQIGSCHGKSFTVYRGQGLSKTDFQKLVKVKGGLMSFNNFLSTSLDREVSFIYAEGALTRTDMVGILFEMSIDPSISSVPFASIREFSYFQVEEEILFSMHTVFRIDEITKIDNNNSLYQVKLKLTADADQELRTHTQLIRKETSDSVGLKRLGVLLVKMGRFNEAEELYKLLLEQTSDDGEKAFYFNQLGYINDDQGDYEKSISYYEKALEMRQTFRPPNYPELATSYNNIGSVYYNMGEHSDALSFYKKSLEILRETLPSNHALLATSYNNIARVFDNMGQHSKALSFFEKALTIDQNTLPRNHPQLAVSYNNIGLVYHNMGEYSKALLFYEKALEICQKTLPSNHPILDTYYNNIATVYYNMGDYSKSLSHCEKALEILGATLPSNHPYFATSYNNIGLVYHNMGEYLKALSFYEKALEIAQKTLPPNHPYFAISYNNIGSAYDSMGQYSKALSFSEKALEISQTALPQNDPYLATSYNCIGGVYYNRAEYSKAFSFYEKALEIQQRTLPANHPSLATSYDNFGMVYDDKKGYSEALSFYEKALGIRQIALPPDHPHLATSYNNIGGVYYNMGEYWKAHSYFERAQNIWQRSLPLDHPHLQTVRERIESVKQRL